MIKLVQKPAHAFRVTWYFKESDNYNELPEYQRALFSGDYLSTFFITGEKESKLLIGIGEKLQERRMNVRELLAKAVKECAARKIKEYSLDISPLRQPGDHEFYYDIAEGLILGGYHQKVYKGEEENTDPDIELYGTNVIFDEEDHKRFDEAVNLAEAICFARDMVNLPGNKLRPEDFAGQIRQFVKKEDIEIEILNADTLKELGMHALLAVGMSSEYPPCMVILRYNGDVGSKECFGLIGKGVTCDTGGYCLKSADSMLGIKGDMAGGAAVAAAICALAKNKVRTNVTAVIPVCENRISRGSLLPGDVIGTYSGKHVEIINTDAEGRLILADAVHYAVKEEGVTYLLDIATLTGAVVGMLGFSIAGAVCDDDDYYALFERAARRSGERYLRIPFYKEHEKMLESKIADIKNVGSKGCGTITAGLFIREFACGKPWLHLDIAGTACVDPPIFEHQSEGATGAGVSTIYHLCSNFFCMCTERTDGSDYGKI